MSTLGSSSGVFDNDCVDDLILSELYVISDNQSNDSHPQRKKLLNFDYCVEKIMQNKVFATLVTTGGHENIKSERNFSFDNVRREDNVGSSLKELDRKKQESTRSNKSTFRRKGVAMLTRFRVRTLLSPIDSNPSLSLSQFNNCLLFGSNTFQSVDQISIIVWLT